MFYLFNAEFESFLQVAVDFTGWSVGKPVQFCRWQNHGSTAVMNVWNRAAAKASMAMCR